MEIFFGAWPRVRGEVCALAFVIALHRFGHGSGKISRISTEGIADHTNAGITVAVIEVEV
jgi:hypothetical protein